MTKRSPRVERNAVRDNLASSDLDNGEVSALLSFRCAP